jgi:hypothetical protein
MGFSLQCGIKDAIGSKQSYYEEKNIVPVTMHLRTVFYVFVLSK